MPEVGGFREYYAQNRERLLQMKSARYQTDPEYRDKLKKSAKERNRRVRGVRASAMRAAGKEWGVRRYNRPKVVQIGDKDVLVHCVREFADKVGRNVRTISVWEEQKVIPPPTVIDDLGRRWYSGLHMFTVATVVHGFWKEGGRDLEELRKRVRGAWEKN